jgi:hypothetical protein
MKSTDFKRLVARDGYCLHCGEDEALSPNHRANRGMGGSKSPAINAPSNLVLICSWLNERIEGRDYFREMAIEKGWKVSKWTDPKRIPVFDECTGVWYYLNDDWSRTVAEEGLDERYKDLPAG